MAGRIRLIVGLGNPGSQYDGTRHNAGADFVTEIARRSGTSLAPESKFFGSIARTTIDGCDVRLLIPSTFMNLSGKAVGAVASFYKIAPDEMIIAHDELDLPPGTARWKKAGGHGGHNGLRDLISALGNRKDFYRLRLGVGHPGKGRDVAAYVLHRAPSNEREQLEAATSEAIQTLPLALNGEWEKAMHQLHTDTD